MPTTRSMRSLSGVTKAATPPKSAEPLRSKRKVQGTTDASESFSQSVKKPRTGVPSRSDTPTSGSLRNDMLPAILTFSFETAKQHLISVDSRFEGVFSKLSCRPFEQLERVDPFRTLTSSILGQQISWLAARSIRHRFIRLYDQSLPEKPPADDSDAATFPKDFFPSAAQVADTDIADLRSAGLSTRKAEYIKDLASRFADGRLTNQRLAEADDEELAKLLIEVRGIGRWTVDMFAMFSLRRPDILPVGDLGVQRGLIRWFLSLHSPSDPVTISSKKLPKPPGTALECQETSGISNGIQQIESNFPGSVGEDISSLQAVPATPIKNMSASSQNPTRTALDSGSLRPLPSPFTPSINKILNPTPRKQMDADETDTGKRPPPSLPDGLTVTDLRSRLNGKKKVKGALLTPKEMEELTDCWRPYRSLGVYYMWALAEETK